MPAQEKEMGLVDLENFLKQTFPENKNKVNILLEQIAKSKAELEKETGEENPFFYGTLSRQMRATASKGIDSWVDNKGNVNIAQINTVAKIAKKELEVAKERKNKEENQSRNVVEQQEEFVKQEFKKIDYENLQAKDLMFVAQNMKIFRENASMEEYKNVVETMNVVLGTPNKFSEWQKLAKFQLDNPDKELDEEQKKILQTVPKELLNKNGKTLDQIKMSALDETMGNVFQLVLNGIEIGKVPNEEEIMVQVHQEMEKRNCKFSEELLNKVFKVNLINELDGKSPEEQENIVNKKIEEQNERHKRENNLNKTEEALQDLDDEFLSALEDDAQEKVQKEDDGFLKTEEQMQEENEQMLNAEFAQMQDYSQLSEEVSFEEDFFAALAEYGEAQMEQASEEIELSNEPEESVAVAEEEEQLKDYEMEIPDEKTGIAGLFSKAKEFIQNIPFLKRRVDKLNEQKRIGEGKPEVTRQDGIKQTSYYGEGSLEPLSVRLRNFAIGIGNNVMETIGRITNSSNREENDIPINRPIVIKSQERDNDKAIEQEVENKGLSQDQQQEMNVLKQAEQKGKKMDDNPWAINVTNNMEEIARKKSIEQAKASAEQKKSQPNRNEDIGK